MAIPQSSGRRTPLEHGGFSEETVDRAERLGIDLGLLEENLLLSPAERMHQHDESVRQILATRERLEVTSDDDS